MLSMLNQKQREAADKILAAVTNNDYSQPHCFFVDGPGGTGKTFLYETLINILHGMNKRVLAIAFTGIASILLSGGKTCHTAFRLPLFLQPDSSCREKADLQKVDVIIWDEASMSSSDMLEIVYHLLRDIMRREDIPFGGKVMVLGGDFKQTVGQHPKNSIA